MSTFEQTNLIFMERQFEHHTEHLQSYINEYTYQLNRSNMKGNIFDNLMHRMVDTPPATYKMLIF